MTAGLVSLLLVVVGLVAVTQTASAAPTDQQCAYATPGTGDYARTLCWLDMSAYSAAEAAAGGQQMQVKLPGGYTLTYDIIQTGRTLTATTFPTWRNAFLGRDDDAIPGSPGQYQGVSGRPALYQVASPTTDSSISMSNITLTDADGNAVRAFAIVAADAESTDSGESLVFSSDKPMRQIAPIGNACPDEFSGLGTTTVTCHSTDGVPRTGTAMLAADSPTTLTQTLKSTMIQGVAFGVLISKVVLSKTVASRVSPSDSFGVSVTSHEGLELASANTGTASTATTGEVETIAAEPSDPFTLAETSTGGNPITAYDQSWSCTRNGAPDASLPSGAAGASAQVILSIGDIVDCTITNTALSGSLRLQKDVGSIVDVNGNGIRDAGDQANYVFSVTNTGAMPIENVAVGDPGVGPVTCSATTLAPGATTTCAAVNPYTFTAADVARGSFTNTATATGNPLGSSTVVTSNSSATTTTLETANAALALTKTADPATIGAPGSVITYDYAVRNTGNVDVSALAIVESAFSGSGTRPVPVCPVTALAPGTSTTCTATYTVTQADLDAGAVTNTAHATARDPQSATVDSPDSSATVTATPTPSISLTKSVTPDDAASFVVGQKLTYSFVATNTGSVTLTNVGITEQAFSGTGGAVNPVCPAGAPIPPLGQVSCTATYTLTQADIDAGDLTNTATAHGSPPTGPAVDSTPSTVAVPSDAAPALELQKSATPATAAAAGDVVDYTFTVTNTGNVTMKDISIAETAFSGSGPVPAVSCPAAAATMLPGARVVCTASYALTALDADQSQLLNTATANGTPPASAGGPVTSAPSTAAVAISESPALTLVKTASPLQATAAGQTVTYSFAVTNTGDVTVGGIAIAEAAFSGSGSVPTPSCPAGAASLAPGATVTCTATYAVTQADADAGGIDNSATAGGTSPSGGSVTSNESQNVVPIAPDPAVTLQKTASVSNVTAAGQTLTYTFLVTNRGNVTLSSADVVEGRFTGHAILNPVCPPGITSIAPGESISCTADYVVTQADMDAGSIQNTATVSGRTPGGAAITTPPSTVTVTAQPAPALELQKSVTPAAITVAGQPVTFHFLITNTGNVTLSDVTAVEGSFSGAGPTPTVTCPAGAASLAPAASVTCMAQYTATQSDVDAGTVTNDATATGVPPAGGTPSVSPSSSATFNVVESPALDIVKSASPTTITRSGELVVYSFVVTNTGNVTMSDVAVVEGSFSGTGVAPVVQCPADPIVLAPGDTITCTATYTATQSDVDAGSVDNAATVQGTPPSSPGVPMTFGPASSRFGATPEPAISIVKSATPSDAASFVPGAVITYTFVVTNTGNVTLDGIQVSDSGFTGAGAPPVPDCSGAATTLAPGDQTSCTATYTVTQADADAGGITNSATASGIPPAGGSPIESEPSTVILPHDAAPALELVKTATVSGSEIAYRFAVTNTGNVTVRNVTIAEGAFSGTGSFPAIDCPAGASALAPGEAIECTATYATTAADRSAGSISNTATAGGDTIGGPVTSSPSSARVTLAAAAALAHTGMEIGDILWLTALFVGIGGALVAGGYLRRRRS
ncbi:DUF11 domain-containing protein [Leifsonia shinshuensis]|uniref:DUF7507 domain-containing protein n=1 Tax=Leifsonia shinshuensis TaxID=150026 RepID=UPI001F51240F|nr:hypothetical protein [Leifsonia shinshuensis]MCI0157030.1 DUF11 domain-containing protein [Leifsonia shinshuensis]